jgi:hypothetical protein
MHRHPLLEAVVRAASVAVGTLAVIGEIVAFARMDS